MFNGLKNNHLDVLYSLAKTGQQALCPASEIRINVGTSSCGIAKGATVISEKFKARKDWGDVANIVNVGCLGACFAEPMVHVRLPNGYHYFFGKVNSKSLWHIIRITEGHLPSSYSWITARERQLGRLQGFSDLEVISMNNAALSRFFKLQQRRISDSWGFIDPKNIAEYIATGGYFSLAESIVNFEPQELYGRLERAGLLEFIIKSLPHDVQQLETIAVGNLRELTKVELALLENNPHNILEGLVLVCYALGISRAYICIPEKYSLATSIIANAINSAERHGFLGNNIFGTNFSVELSLTNEIEQNFQFLTSTEMGNIPLIYNLEHIARIPRLAYIESKDGNKIVSGQLPNTKLYYLYGDFRCNGFVEATTETKIPHLVAAIGEKSSESIKALQPDFPFGTIIPYAHTNCQPQSHEGTSPVSFSELLVLNRQRCIVDQVLQSVRAAINETCTKCLICQKNLPILEAKLVLLTKGQGYPEILNEIDEVAKKMGKTAKYQLSCSIAAMVSNSLRDFRSEYTAHLNGYCPGLTCKELIRYEIIQTKCKDCRCCYLICPSGAVMNRIANKRFFVDDRLCIKCGACAEACPFGCIRPVSEPFSLI